MNERVKDEETEATRSNDLRNNKWLIVAKTSAGGERKKDNTPNASSMTEEPNPTLTNNTTSAATTPPQLQQQHHDEDPVLFASAPTDVLRRRVDVPAVKRHQGPSAPRYTQSAEYQGYAVCGRPEDKWSSDSLRAQM